MENRIKRLVYDRRKGVVYQVLNTVTGQEYIGSTTNLHKRRLEHLNMKQKTALHFDIDKYGKDKFEFNVLEEVSASTKRKLWIALRLAEERRRIMSTNCYNVKKAIIPSNPQIKYNRIRRKGTVEQQEYRADLLKRK